MRNCRESARKVVGKVKKRKKDEYNESKESKKRRNDYSYFCKSHCSSPAYKIIALLRDD